MKKLLSLLLVGAVITLAASCTSDDGGGSGLGITITGIPQTSSIDNLGTLTLSFTVESTAGLASVTITKNGSNHADTLLTSTPQTFSGNFEYTAIADDENSNIEFSIIATDINGDFAVANHTLVVGESTDIVVLDPIDVTGRITADQTWGPNQIVNISGRVIVESGATLTINPGTIVKGAEGEGTNAAVLMVAIGGTLNATGTAESPIIMTTVLDNIEVGQTASTYGDTSTKGKWGGLVILGDAPISSDAAQDQIEGVPEAVTSGLYGGDDPDDNSGTIQYVSIRFGGAVIDAADGKEINGLTLGGVGSGTTIDHIEVFANVDDGIEWFGGTVNVSDVLIAHQGDDALDIDQAWSGTVSNFLLLQDSESDEAMEVDGPEGSSDGAFTIRDGIARSVDGAGSAADFKSRAQGSVSNIVWEGYENSAIKIRASYQSNCTVVQNDAWENLTTSNGSTPLDFNDITFDTNKVAVEVYTGSQNDAATEDCTLASGAQAAAAAEITSGDTATGASATDAWNGWTLSSAKGLLN